MKRPRKSKIRHSQVNTGAARAVETAEAKAYQLDQRVRSIEKQQKSSYIELGQILCQMQDGELWRHLKFDSFEHWLKDAAPVCRAGAYQAMRALRELKEIPVSELRQIDRANIEVLRKVPKQKRASLLKDAKQLSERELRRKVNHDVPEAHVEDLGPLKFKPEKSQRAKIDLALEVASWVCDGISREESLEMLAACFLDAPCEKEGCQGLTNQQAFDNEHEAKPIQTRHAAIQ